jgi:hypothetical protein
MSQRAVISTADEFVRSDQRIVGARARLVMIHFTHVACLGDHAASHVAAMKEFAWADHHSWMCWVHRRERD